MQSKRFEFGILAIITICFSMIFTQFYFETKRPKILWAEITQQVNMLVSIYTQKTSIQWYRAAKWTTLITARLKNHNKNDWHIDKNKTQNARPDT